MNVKKSVILHASLYPKILKKIIWNIMFGIL